MKVTALAIARAVASLGKTLPANDLPAMLDAAASLLVAQGLLRDARTFPDLLKRVWLKEEGATAVMLETATGSAGKTKDDLQLLLQTVLRQKCIVEERANAHLLGGMILSVGDERFDLSLRGALTGLTRTLSAPISLVP